MSSLPFHLEGIFARRLMLFIRSAAYLAGPCWCFVTGQLHGGMLSLPLRNLGLDILGVCASTKVNPLSSNSTTLLGKSRRTTDAKE